MNKINIEYDNSLLDGFDMGVLYGFSLFETFRVDNDMKSFLIERHIERLQNSTRFFGINIEISNDEFLNTINQYISENQLRNKIIRITLTAGNHHKNIKPTLIFSSRENIYSSEMLEKGCRLQISDVRKSESSIIIGHKTANYLENYLCLQDSVSKGFDDVLFLNSQDKITETSKCNIFFVKNSTLYTPDTSCGILPGIIREWVIRKAEIFGIKSFIGSFCTEDLLNADEVFVTNSAMGIMHVKNISHNVIGVGNAGEITKLFSEALF